MPVTSQPEPHAALSWWHLCLFFVLAVILFVILRWQPDGWLQAQIQMQIQVQIEQQARQHGMVVQYKHLDVHGLTLHMDHLSIRGAELPVPVYIDDLTLAPAWTSLLTADPAVHLVADRHGQQVTALISWQGEHIGIDALNANLDVASLQQFWQQRLALPVHVSGRLMLAGDLLLKTASGIPVTGNVNAVWHSATTDITGQDKPLGDYRLILKAEDATKNSWQWLLTGGSLLKLSGQGAIDISKGLPQQWGINGRIRLESVQKGNAIDAMLGGKVAVFSLSGHALNPRWQALAGKN